MLSRIAKKVELKDKLVVESCVFSQTNKINLMKKALPLLLIPLSAFLYAEPMPEIDQNIPRHDELPKGRFGQDESMKLETEEPKTLNLTTEELLARPELLERALDSALNLNHIDNVRFLLPLYQQLEQTDPILILYSQAVLAHYDGNLKEAIKYYREIIAQRPDLTPTRLRLAIVLFEDYQDIAAMDQFEKINSDENLPPPIASIVNNYRTALQQRQSWSIDANVQYLHDNNINNAPKNRYYGNWVLPEAQKAHGFSYQINAYKKTPIAKQWFYRIDGSIDHSFYWDAHNYDELTMRLGAGIGYQNLRTQTLIQPFFEKKWYGEGVKSYNNLPGIKLSAAHWLSPKWQVNGAIEYSRKHQQQYKYLNGDSYSAYANLVYTPSAKQQWLLGTHYNAETAEDNSDAYHRTGVRAGWGQEWAKGVSTFLLFDASDRRYRGDAFLINEPRQEKEYLVHASLWLRNLHFKGLTPRLVATWQKRNSNHFAYNYEKSKVFIEVSKKF